MSKHFKGMRWLKCDLHMHTPADSKHWRGQHIQDGQELAAATAFADACYKKGLDVVGITDHNFISKNFIPYLKIAFDNIEKNYNHKITFFIGFELIADVGKGIHVICLFNPDTNIDEIDHILTECGVGMPRIQDEKFVKSTKRLTDILDVVQKQNKNGTLRGIVIIPHIFNDSLFDNSRISDWLQQEEYLNPELLAVEIPKPVDQMNAAFQKLFRSGNDCMPDWKRIRPIATIMSSDNKDYDIVNDDGTPKCNSIGYRYSWIKMSSPSIEALRQAFLDHESRIRLPKDISHDTHPEKIYQHSFIKSILIKNVAFLADQQVFFSPNMNCIIGGRGSGKSTLLEYLRISMKKDKSDVIDSSTEKRISRIRKTLESPHSIIELCWVNESGIEDIIVWNNGNSTVKNSQMPDLETFFKNLPIRFYSQQQLTHLTDSKDKNSNKYHSQRILELIDGFNRKSLDELLRQEKECKDEIKLTYINLHQLQSLEKQLLQLNQEMQELDRNWKARSEIQTEVRHHQLLKAEEQYLEKISVDQFNEVLDLAERIATSHKSIENKEFIHANWLKQIDAKVIAAKESLVHSIRDAVEKFKRTINELKFEDPLWNTIQEDLAQADGNFHAACSAKGLTVADVGNLNEITQARTNKQKEIEHIETKIQHLKESTGNIESQMQQLHTIWRKQFEKRVEAAERANELAVLYENKQRFIEILPKYQQDYENFNTLWQMLAPSDKRTKIGRNWEPYGEALYNLFIQREDVASPWQILQDRLEAEQYIDDAESVINIKDIRIHIKDNIKQWEELRCARVSDAVDMKLFRPDGSEAGSIAVGTLSDGQRNTAILALLMAQPGGPIIIDQPEDELDSNFVFNELIPMLRKVKLNRQIIMATHNANLPVNGDAELLYAFEARAGKGEVLVCGGLDQEEVTQAVLDIMEGSKEAFRRRREKYHF